MFINGYRIDGDLASKNSGFSKWGFGEKNGRVYFIKEFLAPIYPKNDGSLSAKHYAKKVQECKAFEEKLIKMYNMINRVSDGNVVRVQEFFRCNSKYYIVTEQVRHSGMTIEKIASLPYEAKKFICKIVTHAMLGLHNEGFVHADIKPNNILIVADQLPKRYTAKIIDFDCGFYGIEPPEPGEEINGDPVYFAPEVLLHMMEEDVALSCKIDVFSLGILFHQYMTGRQPYYDTSQYDYASEAVLDDAPITIDRSIPEEFRIVLEKMLLKEPHERCSLTDVYMSFAEKEKTESTPEKAEGGIKIKIYKGN